MNYIDTYLYYNPNYGFYTSFLQWNGDKMTTVRKDDAVITLDGKKLRRIL